ncbi:MAG TPA: hypothetical protein EYF95_04020 [Flavobacteriales bacterium]|jgi:hypothetical protein|nr:hypothetical protein [Flavobacteriales bacterium]
MKAWIKSFIRPIYGLLMIQPVVLGFLLYTYPGEWWDRYILQSGPLQLLLTLYLVPVYHYYDVWWNLHQHWIDKDQTTNS